MSDTPDMTPAEARAWIKKHFVKKVCERCEGECTCEPATYALVSPRPYTKAIRNEFAAMVLDGYFEMVPKYVSTAKLIDEIAARCPECGTSLDEVPFVACQTHRKHAASEPRLTQEEIDQMLDAELARLLHERTGDD